MSEAKQDPQHQQDHDYQENILVVDDNPANLRLLSNMLTEQGYKVRSVINGSMALTAARAAPPDLILLDINMPAMNGYEVCQALKADPATADVPIIFISALDEIQDKVQAFTVGGVDYVTKPFQFEEVLARVETHLALNHLQRELAQANAALACQLREVQARNEELDAFAHTVAHDLKNPLTALLGYSSMLQSRHERMSGQQLADGLAIVTRNGQRMNNIIEELLLMSQVRKVDEIALEPVDMLYVVHEAQDRLVNLIQEHQPQIVVPESWPPALGRNAWVEEVWANYLSNAIKYGGRPPHVELGADPDAGNGAVRFWVRDNGPGLTPQEQASLFAPFERLHHVRAKGHGLGLSIVRRIVDKLGGQVGVESTPGQGSTFYFTLPAAH
jgi:signal transduction histidine kinase